jgi:hypothetical protein
MINRPLSVYNWNSTVWFFGLDTQVAVAFKSGERGSLTGGHCHDVFERKEHFICIGAALGVCACCSVRSLQTCDSHYRLYSGRLSVVILGRFRAFLEARDSGRGVCWMYLFPWKSAFITNGSFHILWNVAAPVCVTSLLAYLLIWVTTVQESHKCIESSAGQVMKVLLQHVDKLQGRELLLVQAHVLRRLNGGHLLRMLAVNSFHQVIVKRG